MTRLTLIFCIVLLAACSNPSKKAVDFTKRLDIALQDSVDHSTEKIGVAAMLSPKEALPAYEELVKYIGKEMDMDIEMVFTKDYATMNDMVMNKQVMAAFVCAGPYVSGHDEWGMQLVVSPSLYGDPEYYSYLIVNKNSKYQSLNDLKGKRFAFTDPKSNTGKLVPTYELVQLGTTPEEFFKDYIYTGSHDKSIEAVANNIVDGAAVDNLIWEYIDSQDNSITLKTKVIDKFGPYSTPPLVVHPDCSVSFNDSLQNILINMHKTFEGKTILKKIHIDKFVIISDSAYSSVREMQEWINNNEGSK